MRLPDSLGNTTFSAASRAGGGAMDERDGLASMHPGAIATAVVDSMVSVARRAPRIIRDFVWFMPMPCPTERARSLLDAQIHFAWRVPGKSTRWDDGRRARPLTTYHCSGRTVGPSRHGCRRHCAVRQARHSPARAESSRPLGADRSPQRKPEDLARRPASHWRRS
jgi:hypothetical protein